MPRKRKAGRPRSAVPLEAITVRISRTVLRAVRSHAKKRGDKVSPTISRLLLLGLACEPGEVRDEIDARIVERARAEGIVE